MKYAFTAAIAALSMASSAGAVTLYANNFDAEGNGLSILNYNSFSGLSVQNGSVDLLNNYPGLPCASGQCVDLDGSTGDAGELVTGFYNFNAGDTVTLSFDMAGNHRAAGSDVFLSGFLFANATQVTNHVLGGAFGASNFGASTSGGWINSARIADNAGFATFTMSFTAGQAGSFSVIVGDSGHDNMGPLLDNLTLDRTPAGAVPEPATWAMMILGFGAAGSVIRRRKALTA